MKFFNYIKKIKKEMTLFLYFLRYQIKTIAIKRELVSCNSLLNIKQYIDSNMINSNNYSYSYTSKESVLYSLVFALLTKYLINNFDHNDAILKHINSLQDNTDGLFRDKKLRNDKVEIIDWWGWRHLSALVVIAVTVLCGKTKYPFRYVEFLYGKGNTRKWLESLNWTYDSSNTSNAIMNYGVCLQYNRDFWDVNEAHDSLLEMFDYLDEIQDWKTGLWGGPFSKNQNKLSQMEQTAYHLWALYFYDQRKINYIEKAIDSCLALQNEFGGFGPGYKVGRVSNPFTSACEDIDCIDPLSRFYFTTDYRKKDIENSLQKAIPWILCNQNKDGGFVFRREEKLVYGHDLMTSQKNESNLFATWFRTLSLAYISKVLPEEEVFKNIEFNLDVNCPGYQFWRNK